MTDRDLIAIVGADIVNLQRNMAQAFKAVAAQLMRDVLTSECAYIYQTGAL